MANNTFTEQTTVLNPMQLQLLRMFSYAKTDEQMQEIQSALSDYFFHKVEEGMDALAEAGKWSDEKSEEIMKEHLHTPYIY